MVNKVLRRYLILVAALFQAWCMPALAAPTHIQPQIVAERPTRAGAPATIAIVMRPEAGWHGYWSNPGDAGLGMTLDWRLPEGAGAGALQYPVPQTLLVSGLMNHVYKGDYAVLVPVTLPEGVAPGTVLPFTVDAQWLACTDAICVPERAVLSGSLVAGTAPPDPRFDAWRARLPAPLGSKATFALTAKGLRIGIPLPASAKLEDPHLFIAEDKVAAYAAPQVFRRKGDWLIVETDRARFAAIKPGAITGVLRLNRAGDGVSLAAAPGAVPEGGEPIAQAAAPVLPSLPLLLLAALAGGLLLNVMPCVFPILSLKALSLARAGESEAEARREGLAYSAGVIAACAALGALLLALRAGGSEVGWAFQLQEPLVVAALLLLAVGVTANLLGLFEFAVPGFVGEANPRGAFATGLLAAFVATPCTGPFMAAAMGAALLLPIAQAMALFVALGVGIALPFLAIAFIPALRRRLPRPGAWMTTFRRIMAIPMGLTALALLWLASRLGGWSFAAACAVAALVLLLLLAATGKRQRRGRGARGIVLAGLAAIVAGSSAALPLSVSAPSSETESLLAARPFSEDALARARASGKPVFAWFTADWCLSCKVNEQVAIERPQVRDAFAKAGVVVLRGDWTRRDPAITRFLTQHGAAGVPLYVWYPAGADKPAVLPQVLTPGTLTELVEP